MSEVSGSIPVSGLCFLLIFVVFTLCLPCYSSLLSACTVNVVLRPRCKGSTLSRHVRGLGFDSRVRTLFSIDLCCIYLVFTMLFIFVKRMYSYVVLRPRCKGSTLSRHVRVLGFDSRVRTQRSLLNNMVLN